MQVLAEQPQAAVLTTMSLMQACEFDYSGTQACKALR